MTPDWLPPQLILNGRLPSDDYATLHTIFQNEISLAGLEIQGSPVWVDRTPDRSLPQYEMGFTHLVTRDDGMGMRTIDYARAKKLSWVKPVIENYDTPEVYSFWHSTNNNDTLYLWLYDHDFVIILRKLRSRAGIRSNAQIIVTSYNVDPNKRFDLQRRYGRATLIL